MTFFRDRGKSFGFALRGLRVLVRTQHNARIHLAASASVVAGGWLSEFTLSEWVLLTLTIALVFMAEALNTAIEFVADAAVPGQNPLIEKAKDVAAGAVLLAAVAAVIVGVLLFGPRLR